MKDEFMEKLLKIMYDFVIVTHLPAFYKINLYNKLSLSLNIYVIFIANNTNEKRFSNFVNLENCNFKYYVLSDEDFQTRDKFRNIILLNRLLNNIKYKKILLSGWDLLEYWYLAIRSTGKTNCLSLESTVLESKSDGIKGFIKKIFLKKITTVFASGDLHVDLLRKLNYKKKIIITKGVGIINKPVFSKNSKEYKKRFIFIGRISKEKNLRLIIEIFNKLPEYLLTIVGDGPQKLELKQISKENIIYHKSIENENIKEILEKNNILILASVSETWGLVIEEALYFGLPVIVSKNCGACELVVNGINGFIIDPNDSENIKNTILKIDGPMYDELERGVEKKSIINKDINQVRVYGTI